MAPNLLTTKATMEGLDRKRKKYFTLIEATLGNKEVEEKYYEYVKRFSNKKYLEEAFKSLSKDIADAEKLLNYEYPNIQLDKEFFRNNAKQIREQLKEYGAHRKNLNEEVDVFRPFQELPEGVVFTDIALKANIEKRNENGSVEISLRNYHSADLEIYGYSTKADKKNIIPIPLTVLKALEKESVKETIRLKEKPRRLHYRVKNCPDQSFKAKLNKWGAPTVLSFLNLKIGAMPNDPPGDKIVIRGNQVFSHDFYVPKGKTLQIEGGTNINLINNAAIISHGPIDIRGKENSQVRITSSDGSSNGVVILSSEKSKMSYATFDNLSSIDRESWVLTGAVTFYGGDVTIDNCTFTNNHCEDGLNLIRCQFSVTNSTVSNTYSDGFDADFCAGTVKHSTFQNTGNDCIDFSGSKITISYCKIIDAGDKGISGGEDSDLEVEYCTVERAHIAFASKDLSTVNISFCTILEAKYGFAAYRKKPEYGGGKLIVEDMKKMNAEQLHLLEKGSSMRYMNKDYHGAKKFDIDAMYAMYTK
jgi:hypothetical protein